MCTNPADLSRRHVVVTKLAPLAVVLLMGFLSSLFGHSNGGGDKPGRHVSEGGFRENLAKQKMMSPQTVAQLHKHGATEESMLKLEFFFYTNEDAKAQALAKDLKDLDYKVEYGPTNCGSRLFIVTGWTTSIRMSESTVVAWTEKMCQMAYDCDCEFDGWGTNPRR
jgi:hypothetical protein